MTGGLIAHGPAQLHGGGADALPERQRQIDARRNLHHLLVAPLHGAIALPQVHELAVLVAEDLHFDVLGAPDVAFDEHVGAAEGGAGLALRFLEFSRQLVGVLHHAHPAAAATEAGLDNDGEADVPCRLAHVGQARDSILSAGYRRHVRLSRQLLRGHLVAEGLELSGCRTDEGDARQLARPRKIGIL